MSIDFSAPVVAGVSAAGFQIGRHIQDYEADLTQARIIQYYEGFNLVQEINQNTGLLRIDGFGGNKGSCFYFGPDTVRLVFTSQGILGCIYVCGGYAGTYVGAQIGDPLASVSEDEPLEYDHGDEMYYRIDPNGNYIAGLAIEAMEVALDEHPTTPINGFCVHDWSLFS
jgi:hypothetical protein